MVWYNPMTWRADPQWPILSGMPSVQVRLLSLIALDFLTFVGTQHSIETIQHNPAAANQIIVELWAIWYGLLGGMHGLGYAQYRTKRRTASDGNLTEDQGGGGPVTMEMPAMPPAQAPPPQPPAAPMPVVPRPSPAEPSD